MKLSHIREGVNSLPTSPQDRQAAARQAKQVASSPQDAAQLQKSIQQRQKAADVDPNTGSSRRREKNSTLQQLASTDWDQANPKFQKLAAKMLDQ